MILAAASALLLAQGAVAEAPIDPNSIRWDAEAPCREDDFECLVRYWRQLDEAYKLVLIINGTSVVIDYPNRHRCMEARVAAEQAAEDDSSMRSMSDDERLSDGLVRRPPIRIIAFCIPA